MLKNKIYKYFTFEILKSFLTILFAFTAIAWTVRAVNFLDLIVDNGHSVTTYLMYSLYNITNIITKFIPLSFLFNESGVDNIFCLHSSAADGCTRVSYQGAEKTLAKQIIQRIFYPPGFYWNG